MSKTKNHLNLLVFPHFCPSGGWAGGVGAMGPVRDLHATSVMLTSNYPSLDKIKG